MEGLTTLVQAAIDEDVGGGDVTASSTIDVDAPARARIVQKAPGVIYGLEPAALAFALLDPDVRVERHVAEGVWRERGER